MPGKTPELEASSIRKEVLGSSPVFLIGLALDARAFSLKHQESLANLVSVTPFAFFPPEGEQPSFLTPLPLRETSLPEDEITQINEQLGELLKKQFVDTLRVKEGKLGFSHLEDGEISPWIRHEMGYHLLNKSEENDPKIPDTLRDAFRNTGMMFLLSVGIDRWLSEEERFSMFEAYRERFEPLLGKLRFKFIGRGLKRHREVEFVDTQLEFMARAQHSLKQVDAIHDIIELGEGYIFTASQLAKRGVIVELITESPDLYPELPGYPLKSVVFSLA